MKKSILTKLFVAAAAVLSFTSCEDKPFEDLRSEYYARNFIKEFGLIDPEQDWNMAKEGVVTLDMGEERANVQIYGQYDGKYYLVADLKGMKGKFEVPFDVPKECENVMVKVNGNKYYGQIGQTIDCSNHPASRSSYNNGTFTYESGNPAYDATIGGVTVKVGRSTLTPDGHIYFNAQQMGPILAKNDWPDYYSMTDGALKTNDAIGEGRKGILPEIMTENQPYSNGNANKHDEVTEDFVYQLVDPMKGFDIYPMFYGSNLRHTLGVYLLSDEGKPLDANGQPIDITGPDDVKLIAKYPIYQSKHGDDIKVSVKPRENTEVPNEEYNALVKLAFDETTIDDKYEGGYPIELPARKQSCKVSLVFFDKNGNVIPTPSYFTVTLKNTNEKLFVDYGNDHPFLNGGTVANKTDFWLYADEGFDSGWINFNVNVNGVKTEIPVIVDIASESNEIRRVEIWDGSNKVSPDALGNPGITVAEGSSKTYTVKCYNKRAGGTLVSTPANLKAISWNTSIFTATMSGDQLTITGVNGNVTDGGNPKGVQWGAAYIDTNNNNNKDGSEVGQSFKVTVTPVHHHSHTEALSPWPSTSAINYNDYFYQGGTSNGETSNKPQVTSEQDSEKAPTFSKPRRVVANLDVWTGAFKLENWNNTPIDANLFPSDLTNYSHIQLEFTSVENGAVFKLASNPSNWNTFVSDAQAISLTSSENVVTIPLDEKFDNATTIRSQIPNTLIVYGDQATLTRVRLISNDNNAGYWIANKKADLIQALEAYFNANAITFQCDANDNGTLVSTDQNVNVSISINGYRHKDNTNIYITLTERTPSAASAPSRRSATQRGNASGRAADQAYTELTSPGGALYHDGSTQWHDIRKKYVSEIGTTDSYDYNEPLLVKSQGYHVDLKIGDKYWYGFFGMYIDYEWGEDIEKADDSVNDSWAKAGDWGRPKTGTHFSQSSLNLLTYDGHTYPISYAATFKHPKSTNQYLCFEDWDVTLPVGDADLNGIKNTSAEYNTTNFWSGGTDSNGNAINLKNWGHYSSDRDLNDIIYRQVGLIPTRSNDLSTENEGFDWIWAVEDLGSTDDFDFNDVVIRLKTMTTTVESTGDENPQIVKKITFKPLAAGGTLPIYIHFYYWPTNDDYILRPGSYDLTKRGHSTSDESSVLSTTDGLEYHKWFNSAATSSTMINTDAKSNKATYALSTSQECVLIVNPTFSLNAAIPHPGSGNTDINQGATSADANGFEFYITVNGPTAKTTQENINGNSGTDRLEGESYKVGMPVKGAAAQSFVIVEVRRYTSQTGEEDTPTDKTHNFITGSWKWPKERVHILDAYPDFKEWVKDKSNRTWYLNPRGASDETLVMSMD